MKTIAFCLFLAVTAGTTAHAQLRIGTTSSASVHSAAGVHTPAIRPAIRPVIHGATSAVKATGASTVGATRATVGATQSVAGKTMSAAGNAAAYTNVSAGASSATSANSNIKVSDPAIKANTQVSQSADVAAKAAVKPVKQ